MYTMYVYICVYVHAYGPMYMLMHICVCAHTHTLTHACDNNIICLRDACMHTSMHASVQASTHADVYDRRSVTYTQGEGGSCIHRSLGV